jgi:hypothetical protein
MEILCKYGVFPLRHKYKYTFYRNGRTSYPDIISVTKKVYNLHVRSKVLDIYSASDDSYVLHVFKTKTSRCKTKLFKYITKGLVPENFLSRFEDILNEEDFNIADVADKAELVQKCIERTCESTLRKVGCTVNKKYCNYWWNDKIAELRALMLKALRRVARERKRKSSRIDHYISGYKNTKRKLKIEIAGSKMTAWAGFCKILEGDPWGKPYRTVMNRCKSKGPVNVMPISKVKEILKNLFSIGHKSSQHEVYERDTMEDSSYNITLDEDDVIDIAGKINAKKAVGIDCQSQKGVHNQHHE